MALFKKKEDVRQVEPKYPQAYPPYPSGLQYGSQPAYPQPQAQPQPQFAQPAANPTKDDVVRIRNILEYCLKELDEHIKKLP